jgi:hypothetical protein
MVSSVPKDVQMLLARPSLVDVAASNRLLQGKMLLADLVLRATLIERPSLSSFALRMVRSLAVHRPKQGVVNRPVVVSHASCLQRVLALHSKPAGVDAISSGLVGCRI